MGNARLGIASPVWTPRDDRARRGGGGVAAPFAATVERKGEGGKEGAEGSEVSPDIIAERKDDELVFSQFYFWTTSRCMREMGDFFSNWVARIPLQLQ